MCITLSVFVWYFEMKPWFAKNFPWFLISLSYTWNAWYAKRITELMIHLWFSLTGYIIWFPAIWFLKNLSKPDILQTRRGQFISGVALIRNLLNLKQLELLAHYSLSLPFVNNYCTRKGHIWNRWSCFILFEVTSRSCSTETQREHIKFYTDIFYGSQRYW